MVHFYKYLYCILSLLSRVISSYSHAEVGMVQSAPEFVNVEGSRNRLSDGLDLDPGPGSGILFRILREFVLIYLT